jgi:hypothetical protein
MRDILYILYGNSSGTTILVNIVTPSYSCTNGCTSCHQTYTLNTSTLKCDKIINRAPQNTTTISSNNVDWLKEVIESLSINLSFLLQISSNKVFTKQTIHTLVFLDDF